MSIRSIEYCFDIFEIRSNELLYKKIDNTNIYPTFKIELKSETDDQTISDLIDVYIDEISSIELLRDNSAFNVLDINILK
jgi:hypothetical protein